jgi:hypothetical protein
MIKASIKVDVAQGDDPDALVAEMFARSIDPETLMKMIIRPTGKIGGGGHPEWEIEGNTIAVLIALLNYSGFDVHMVEELANTFSGITFTEVFDPDYEPDIAVGRPTEIVNFGEHGFGATSSTRRRATRSTLAFAVTRTTRSRTRSDCSAGSKESCETSCTAPHDPDTIVLAPKKIDEGGGCNEAGHPLDLMHDSTEVGGLG